MRGKFIDRLEVYTYGVALAWGGVFWAILLYATLKGEDHFTAYVNIYHEQIAEVILFSIAYIASMFFLVRRVRKITKD